MCIAETREARGGGGRPIKCQGWKGGENWSKLCSLGGRVSSFNTGSNIGMRDVLNLLLVGVNLNPVLCR